MAWPLPEGSCSPAEIAGRYGDDCFLRREAWRAICDATIEDRITAYVLVEDRDGRRRSHEAERAQFAALREQEPVYASCEDQWRTANGEEGRGRLFFREADLQKISLPPITRDGRRSLPPVRLGELRAFLSENAHLNRDDACEAARKHFFPNDVLWRQVVGIRRELRLKGKPGPKPVQKKSCSDCPD
jgi:hypothetical protein